MKSHDYGHVRLLRQFPGDRVVKHTLSNEMIITFTVRSLIIVGFLFALAIGDHYNVPEQLYAMADLYDSTH